MFALFKSPSFHDKELGNLSRSGGYWRGSLFLAPCGAFPLAVQGSRKVPDQVFVELARELPKRFSALMAKIRASLFQHYAPYKEAVDAGELTGSPCPNISTPEEVWSHVTPAHILVEPLQGEPSVEIAFRADWDVEHTLGARFRHWDLIELNGSVRGI